MHVESIPAIYPGDIVEMRVPTGKTAGKVFKVTKLLNVNVQMVDEGGQVWRAPFNAVMPSARLFTEAAFVPVLGSIVTINNLAGYYVVIKIDAARSTANVAKMGGDSNRYYKNIGLARLVDANGEVLGKL